MSDKYILQYGEPVKEPDLFKWGNWIESHGAELVVGKTRPHKGVLVSTVFLGLNQRYNAVPPLLYETMVFVEDEPNATPTPAHLDGMCARYSTRDQAQLGHEHMVAEVQTILLSYGIEPIPEVT